MSAVMTAADPGRSDLGADPAVPHPVPLDVLIGLGFSAVDKWKRLVSEAHAADTRFGVELSGEGFVVDDPRHSGMIWVGR
ncbi:hypothetical protein [Mycobacterium spongiae]|uniref:Uncharacterized protein n=1 Tax=Mycobacterium spongiae TaxID=886343 RepID=A0A975JY06_9MYCO|nr:hypothetical protein [Mycobacterium spongiae]QUR67787.1 hypothetical protein F6B93_12350 [Mycobacterium spongiae]